MVEKEDSKLLKKDPKMKIKDIKEKAQRKWNVMVNKTKSIREIFAASNMVYGLFLGDDTRIYDYYYKILRTNHGSTVKLNVLLVQEGIDDRRPYFKKVVDMLCSM